MTFSKIINLFLFLVSICFLIYIPINFIISSETNAETVQVVGITDGDTIAVLNSKNETFKVRLAEIDAPEKNQPFSNKSKQILSDKIFQKRVFLKESTKDLYGRTVSKIYLDSRYINEEMVIEGWAWHYVQYSKSKDMANAQDYAKNHNLGLWVEHDPIPPWLFRKKKKK